MAAANIGLQEIYIHQSPLNVFGTHSTHLFIICNAEVKFCNRFIRQNTFTGTFHWHWHIKKYLSSPGYVWDITNTSPAVNTASKVTPRVIFLAVSELHNVNVFTQTQIWVQNLPQKHVNRDWFVFATKCIKSWFVCSYLNSKDHMFLSATNIYNDSHSIWV